MSRPPPFVPEVADLDLGETEKMTLLKSLNDALDIVLATDDTVRTGESSCYAHTFLCLGIGQITLLCYSCTVSPVDISI